MSKSEPMSLREMMGGWVEGDNAQHMTALALGILGPEVSFQTEAKHVFWTDNPLSHALQEILDVLVRVGAVEYDSGEQLYRWNERFVWKNVSSGNGP